MSDRTETYDVRTPVRVDIRALAGDVIVREADDDKVKIILSGHADTVNATLIDVEDDTISIRTDPQRRSRRFFARGMDIIVTMPPGGIVHIAKGAGDTRLRLPLREVQIESGSGDVRLDYPVGDVKIKVASGEVTCASVEGEIVVTSASGDIKLKDVNDATVNTASGSTRLGRVSGMLKIKSASGDIRIKDFEGSELEVHTLSGDTTVGLAPGRTVKASIKTLSGEFRNRITPTEGERVGEVTLEVHSFSGDVTLRSPW